MRELIPAILAVFALSAFFPALGDTRIEIDNDGLSSTCHAPFDAAKTDNESKMPCNTAISVQDDDNGLYDGYFSRDMVLPQNSVNRIFANAEQPQPKPGQIRRPLKQVRVTSTETGEACTLQVDDTNYSSNDWSVEWLLYPRNRVLVEIDCRNGTAD